MTIRENLRAVLHIARIDCCRNVMYYYFQRGAFP